MLNEFQKYVELSKLPKKRKYLHYYIAGFVDGEGCFSISVKKDAGARFGYVIDPVFHITQKESSRKVLELIKNTLKCGRIIRKHGQSSTLRFIVDNRRQLAEKILPFFDKYKLIVKSNEFEVFKRIVEGLENKEHATKHGFINLLKTALSIKKSKGKRRYSESYILKNMQDPQRPYAKHSERS